MMETVESEPSSSEGPTLFGRKIAEIPCFRNSYLYGISSGIGGGLVAFMFTSRPRVSAHIGFASFVGVTVSYWMFCRYQWEERRKENEILKQKIQEYLQKEGTASDIEIQTV